MPMQIRGTATPNSPPSGLVERQLSVEMGSSPPILWCGVPTSVDASGRVQISPPIDYVTQSQLTAALPTLPLAVANGGTAQTSFTPVTRAGVAAPAILGGNGTTALFPSPTWGLGTQGILGTMHSTTLEPYFSMLRGRPGPAAVQSGDRLGTIAFGGYLTATTTVETNVAIFARASETWTAATGGAELVFNVTPNGTTTGLPALLINQDRTISLLGLPVTGAGPDNAILGGNGDRALFSSPVWGVGYFGLNGSIASDVGGESAYLGFYRTRGTRATPAPLQSGDFLLNVGTAGFPDNPAPSVLNAYITVTASENWTATAQGTRWQISCCPSGTASPSTVLSMYDQTLAFTGTQGLMMGPFGNRVYARVNPPGGINLTSPSQGAGLFYTIGPPSSAWVDGNWTFANDVTVNGAWSNPCDRRLKTVDAPFERGLDELLLLQPVRFHHDRRTMPVADDDEHYGLIADEVEEVMPELVHRARFPARGEEEPPGEEYKFLDAGSLTFVLINAIKTLADRVARLERARPRS